MKPLHLLYLSCWFFPAWLQAHPLTEDHHTLVFQWQSFQNLTPEWTLCFDRPVQLSPVLPEQTVLSAQSVQGKDASYCHEVKAEAPSPRQHQESWYLSDPTAFREHDSMVRYGQETYPMAWQRQVFEAAPYQTVQEYLSESGRPAFAALHWPISDQAALYLQPLGGNRDDWALLPGDSEFLARHRRALLETNHTTSDPDDEGSGVILTPLIGIGIAFGGALFGCLTCTGCVIGVPLCILCYSECYRRMSVTSP